MRLPRVAMRRWVAAVSIATAALGSLGQFGPVRADERRTFCGKSVDEWIAIVHVRSSPDRGRALRALWYLGPEAKAAVPDLVDALRKGDFDREFSKTFVIDVLAYIGPDAAPAVPFLIEEFRKEDCFLAKQGSFGVSLYSGPKHALVRIGAASVPPLITALENLDGDRRPCAAEALGEIGPPAKQVVPALIRALQLEHSDRDFAHPDVQDMQREALRHAAIIALGRIGPAAAAAVPALKSFVGVGSDADKALDKIGALSVAEALDRFVKEGDASALTLLGSKAKAAIPGLRHALSDPRVEIRIDAAIALAGIEPPALEAIPVLIDAMNRHREEASSVPSALAKLGPAASAAIPSLSALLTPDTEWCDALLALVQIDPEGRQCIPALIGALKSTQPDFVYAATESLGLLGPRAKAAIPALVGVLRSKLPAGSGYCTPQVSAAKALGRIDPDGLEVLPALIEAVKDRTKTEAGVLDGALNEAVARVLGAIGPRAKSAVPALVGLLHNRRKDEYPYTTFSAVALALGRIGPEARAAIPVLREKVDEDGLTSSAAVVALYQVAPEGKSIAEEWLRKTERAKGDQWRLAFNVQGRAFVLAAMGRPSLEADALTRSMLEHLDWIFQGADTLGDVDYPEWMFVSLGDHGVGSRLAISRLTDLSKHRNPWIRQWAGEALGRITRADRSAPRTSSATHQSPD
jgi:HEAT repeat protein